MKKSTFVIVLSIGILSILFGAYGYLKGSDAFSIYSSVFLGIVLIGSIIIEKKNTKN